MQLSHSWCFWDLVSAFCHDVPLALQLPGDFLAVGEGCSPVFDRRYPSSVPQLCPSLSFLNCFTRGCCGDETVPNEKTGKMTYFHQGYVWSFPC